ncbi:MAG: CoA transferase, partial [bacterium]|nr:CoA transferase [bacterium]
MGVLNGTKICDLSRILAGPFATMILADLGAEVIKIEPPEGDDTRSWGPPFYVDSKGQKHSAYFLSVNRNKKIVKLNLKNEEDRKKLQEIIKESDVFVENFRKDTLKKLGFDYESVKKIKKNIIYCSITGYGQTGPYSHKPGYDLIAQGLSGIMDITGNPDSMPTKVGTSIGDLVAGLYAVIGILAGINFRNKTNKGVWIDISLLDSLVSLLTYQAGIYFATGIAPTRRGNEHPTICPYETFRGKDGYFNVAVGNDKMWEIFLDAIGLPELKNDEKFKTNENRVKNRKILIPILDKHFGKKPV